MSLATVIGALFIDANIFYKWSRPGDIQVVGAEFDINNICGVIA